MKFGSNYNLNLLTEGPNRHFQWEGEFFDKWSSHRHEQNILILEKFIKPEFCQAMLSFFGSRSDWRKSITYGETPDGEDHSPRQSWQITLGEHLHVDSLVFQAFNAALERYRELHPYVLVNSDEGYSLLRYKAPVGEYRHHIDASPENGRVVSGLIYLNNDYVGGELDFPEQKMTLKPAPGDVVLFPSCFTHPHASLPVTEGTKYSIVTWFK